jgi:hypothetical protein
MAGVLRAMRVALTVTVLVSSLGACAVHTPRSPAVSIVPSAAARALSCHAWESLAEDARRTEIAAIVDAEGLSDGLRIVHDRDAPGASPGRLIVLAVGDIDKNCMLLRERNPSVLELAIALYR